MEEVILSSGRIVKIKDEYVPWVFLQDPKKMSNEEKIKALLSIPYFVVRDEKRLEEVFAKNEDDAVMEGIVKARELEFGIG